MSTTFPRTNKKTRGYDLEEVEQFLAAARRAYDSKGGMDLTAEGIRRTAFGMQKGGYSPSHVDAALERLEDAFAARERELAATTRGQNAQIADARASAQVILNRLGRPPGHKFRRTSYLSVGYKRKDVDRFANKLVKYFQDGRPLTPDDVRAAVFRSERGGYKEMQVDVLLDSVVAVMLMVR